MLITTHYMDEADKLCDRIAIVDHGKLMALDSPLRLKAAVPGENMLEVLFGDAPADWKRDGSSALPAVGGGDIGRKCVPHLVDRRPGDDDGAARCRGAGRT